VSKNSSLAEKRSFLEVRSRLLMALRTFFYDHDYLEVETPVRLKYPALEDYIDAEQAGDSWLRTSPELHMKRLVAAGYEKIFQIGPCFRLDECGERHRPEFTMLEWYETGTDYRGILQQTMNLLRSVSRVLKVRQDYFNLEWQVLTVEQAFVKYTGKGVDYFIENDKFEETLCFEVEPHLGISKPTVLIDYPASMAALSKKKDENPAIAERWELYIDGLEIANAYSELTDVEEQRQRFEKTRELRAGQGRVVYDIDPDFMAALENGLPDCGGIALGVDRLCMVFSGATNIEQVVFE
jgi:elongation factor P--(R)-beta-lysine ligase